MSVPSYIFDIGTTFIRIGRKRKDLETVIDRDVIHTTIVRVSSEMSDLHNLKRVLMELPETEQKRIAIQAGILDIESVLMRPLTAKRTGLTRNMVTITKRAS